MNHIHIPNHLFYVILTHYKSKDPLLHHCHLEMDVNLDDSLATDFKHDQYSHDVAKIKYQLEIN